MKKNRTRKDMAAANTRRRNGDDMPAEIDFSGGVRGKFHRPNAKLNRPIYLEADVQTYLAAIAAKKGVPLSDLANDLLKKEIAILEALK
jgi:hypothetical protein